jgi:hypothetical protein
MIAQIIKAEEHTTMKGREVIRLTVLDDYEQERLVFISPEALWIFSNFVRVTRIPVITRKGYQFINLKRAINKLISVEEIEYAKYGKQLVYRRIN